jgi:hypothetical protein
VYSHFCEIPLPALHFKETEESIMTTKLDTEEGTTLLKMTLSNLLITKNLQNRQARNDTQRNDSQKRPFEKTHKDKHSQLIHFNGERK